MAHPDNPAAFPRTLDADEMAFASPQEGMSLRDWFAGQALPAALERAFNIETSIGKQSPVAWATKLSFRIADAMLTERASDNRVGEGK